MAAMVTLTDIAREAGVSIGVVSRVLNNDESLRIRDETRERVVATASRLDYRPNVWGRALRMARIGAIGLIVPDVTSPIFGDLLKGVETAADRHDLDVMLGRSEYVGEGSDLLARLAAGRVDAFIVQPQDDPNLEELWKLREATAPVVLINSVHSEISGSVTANDQAAGQLATEHLLELGHQRIGFMGGLPVSYTGQQRLAGFRLAMHTASRPVYNDLLTDYGYTVQNGREAASLLLGRPHPPTGIVVSSINSAIGALSLLHERGVRIPDDFSVVSIHDFWISESLTPTLTAVRMPLFEMGVLAVDALVERLKGADAVDTQVPTMPIIMIRGSTGPPNV